MKVLVVEVSESVPAPPSTMALGVVPLEVMGAPTVSWLALTKK